MYVGMPPQSMYMYTESCTVYCACASVCHFYCIIVQALGVLVLCYVLLCVQEQSVELYAI